MVGYGILKIDRSRYACILALNPSSSWSKTIGKSLLSIIWTSQLIPALLRLPIRILRAWSMNTLTLPLMRWKSERLRFVLSPSNLRNSRCYSLTFCLVLSGKRVSDTRRRGVSLSSTSASSPFTPDDSASDIDLIILQAHEVSWVTYLHPSKTLSIFFAFLSLLSSTRA